MLARKAQVLAEARNSKSWFGWLPSDIVRHCLVNRYLGWTPGPAHSQTITSSRTIVRGKDVSTRIGLHYGCAFFSALIWYDIITKSQLQLDPLLHLICGMVMGCINAKLWSRWMDNRARKLQHQESKFLVIDDRDQIQLISETKNRRRQYSLQGEPLDLQDGAIVQYRSSVISTTPYQIEIRTLENELIYTLVDATLIEFDSIHLVSAHQKIYLLAGPVPEVRIYSLRGEPDQRIPLQGYGDLLPGYLYNICVDQDGYFLILHHAYSRWYRATRSTLLIFAPDGSLFRELPLSFFCRNVALTSEGQIIALDVRDGAIVQLI